MQDRDPDENGWQSSAPAWIARMDDGGDFSRAHVLDRVMLGRATAQRPQNALDIGCGEGRFCRLLSRTGIATTGLDPVAEMIKAAQGTHPEGEYIQGFAENLPFPEASFDLIVSYLSLIDIDDADRAIAEMARVTKPGGRILVANLSSFSTSGAIAGHRICKETGEDIRPLGHYLTEEKTWFEWDGLRIRNWHRPLSRYMQWFLQAGLTLTHFDEPQPTGGPPDRVAAYAKNPYLMVMEWVKPT